MPQILSQDRAVFIGVCQDEASFTSNSYYGRMDGDEPADDLVEVKHQVVLILEITEPVGREYQRPPPERRENVYLQRSEAQRCVLLSGGRHEQKRAKVMWFPK